MNNEVAVITGGYSGIGAATVKKLASQGAVCAIIGRHREKAQQFIRGLPEYSARLFFYEVDVADPQQVEESIGRIYRDHGRLDMLVNSAGTSIRKPAMEFGFEDWKRVLETNLTGTFLVSQQAAKFMKDNQGGRIVNIGSMISHYGVHNVIAYAASKGGVSQLTRALAVEWAEYGIRVNQVSPGYIATPFSDLSTPDKLAYRNKIIQRTPMKRMGTPEEVANMIVFLLSEEAGFVTGQIVAVDGGVLGGDPTLNPLQP
jgi:NAD(P)-dependent dehydrogenase (short-subunit alcohol dehydrogenase family)